MTKETQLNLSRWIVFILIALAAVIPFLIDFKLPTVPSKSVDDLYNAIEALPAGSVVLFSFDFDPGSEAEIDPMARAMLRQCFRRHLRVVTLSLYMPQSAPLMNDLVMETAGEFKDTVKEGKDFALLTFNPGAQATILGMGEDFYLSFPEDWQHRPLKPQEVMKGVASLKNVDMVIDLAAGSLPDTWITFGQDKNKFKMGLGCTAVMATDYFPYLDSHQLVGLVGGMAGAYRYENLIGVPGKAGAGMRSLSIIHLVIIGLIVIGNALYFFKRRSR